MSTFSISHFVFRWTLLLGPLIVAAPSAVFGDEPESPPIRFLLEWGHRGSAPGEFDFPMGIVVDGDGAFCVSDFYTPRTQRFSPEGKFLSSFAVLPNPGGLAVESNGNLSLTHFTAM